MCVRVRASGGCVHARAHTQRCACARAHTEVCVRAHARAHAHTFSQTCCAETSVGADIGRGLAAQGTCTICLHPNISGHAADPHTRACARGDLPCTWENIGAPAAGDALLGRSSGGMLFSTRLPATGAAAGTSMATMRLFHARCVFCRPLPTPCPRGGRVTEALRRSGRRTRLTVAATGRRPNCSVFFFPVTYTSRSSHGPGEPERRRGELQVECPGRTGCCRRRYTKTDSICQQRFASRYPDAFCRRQPGAGGAVSRC